MNEAIAFTRWWIATFENIVLGYFITLNSLYLMLVILAAVGFARYLRRVPFAGHHDVFANPLTPGVSIIVPARNEEAGIVESVRAMLSLRYPLFELIIVDDGSTDATFDRLQQNFDLIQIDPPAVGNIAHLGPVLSVHMARNGDPITVVRKENRKSRADAMNVGLNFARQPLVCMIDADSLLDPEALLHVAKPFVDDPERVVATGGVVRPANGCLTERGQILDVRMPRSWIERIQVVEYLRSFLLGRTGWSTLGGLLIISGAFGMFRRDLVLAVGGLDPECMGEDAELVVKIHRYLRERGQRKYKVVFVSEPVCWTEVPVTREVLARQRKRWSRGLAEVLWKHKAMMLNPRYGRIGMVVMPYYLVFELLGPIIELAGVLTVAAVVGLWGAGQIFDVPNWLINTRFAVLFAAIALGYGFFLSLAAMTVEEFSFHRMRTWRDVTVSFFASIMENIGFRQLHAWWRLKGLWWWATRGDNAWGVMPRQGFSQGKTEPSIERELVRASKESM